MIELLLDIEVIENFHDNKHISDAVCWLLDENTLQQKCSKLYLKLKLQGQNCERPSEIMPKIPYGELYTYGEIANKVKVMNGKDRMSAQAKLAGWSAVLSFQS